MGPVPHITQGSSSAGHQGSGNSALKAVLQIQSGDPVNESPGSLFSGLESAIPKKQMLSWALKPDAGRTQQVRNLKQRPD